MKTIVLVNQKGGVGKTTFADEIAWGLERRGREVGFINLDPQGGASHEQKTVEGEKAVTVVDTPGYLNDKLGGCVEVADIAIVPVEPSQRGLRAMKRTIQLITGVNPELEIGLIVNRYSDKRIIDRSFTDFLTAEAFKRGASFNRPVSEVQPGGRAADAIEGILDKVEAML